MRHADLSVCLLSVSASVKSAKATLQRKLYYLTVDPHEFYFESQVLLLVEIKVAQLNYVVMILSNLAEPKVAHFREKWKNELFFFFF